MFNSGPLSGTPPVVKNLLIINILLLIATWVVAGSFNVDLRNVLGMFYFKSDNFQPYQIVTHMFMHGGFIHLFFNMFMLWMFGRVLESVWGSQRFFIFYIVCGLGAAFLHSLVNFIDIKLTLQDISQEVPRQALQNLFNSIPPVVGASGAVYGILLGFGMLFPNTPLFIWFIPIPIKAKYVVIGMIVLELYLGFQNTGGNIAHFAHLGGALFGYILIKYWNKKTNDFY